MVERRSARRYDLSLPITIRVSANPDAVLQIGKTQDISTEGVYFGMDNDLGIGTGLDLTVILSAEVTGCTDVFVRATGRIVRVENRCKPKGVVATISRYQIVRNTAAMA